LGQTPPPTHQKSEVEIVEEVKTGKFRHTGNSGGGVSGYDGKYTDVEKKVVGKEVKTVFAQAPPEPKKNLW